MDSDMRTQLVLDRIAYESDPDALAEEVRMGGARQALWPDGCAFLHQCACGRRCLRLPTCRAGMWLGAVPGHGPTAWAAALRVSRAWRAGGSACAALRVFVYLCVWCVCLTESGSAMLTPSWAGRLCMWQAQGYCSASRGGPAWHSSLRLWWA